MILIVMLFAALAAVVALAGCNDDATNADAAERIQVDDTHVYLSPTGDPSTFQLTHSLSHRDRESESLL